MYCYNALRRGCPECAPTLEDGWIVHEDDCEALRKVSAIYRRVYGKDPDFSVVREKGGKAVQAEKTHPIQR